MTREINPDTSSYLDWSGKGKSGVGRYLGGLTLATLALFLSVGSLAPLVLGPDQQNSLLPSTLADLLSFAVAFLAIPLIVRLIHQRPSWSVAMARPQIGWRDFLTAFAVGAAVSALGSLIFSLAGLMPVESNPAFEWGPWLALVPLGLVGVFVQAGSEEILFRGYWTQFFRSITSNRLVFIGVPAALFASPHILNVAAYGESIFAIGPYLIVGLMLGWVAYRSGSLWMSLGLHLAINYSNLILVGTEGDVLPTAAPFQIEAPSLALGTLAIAASSIVTVLVLEYLLKRRAREHTPVGGGVQI